MIPDRTARKKEGPRNFVEIGTTIRRGQHLTFALCQWTDPVAQRRCGQTWVDDPLASRRSPDGVCELFGWGIFEQETKRTRRHRAPEKARLSKCGQDQAAALRELFVQRRGRSYSVAAWHLDVDKRHIRLGFDCRRQQLISSPSFGDHLDVVLHRQQCPDGASYHRLILCDQNPDHSTDSGSAIARSVCVTGTVANSRKPEVGRADASRVPPSPARRSCSPRSPLPAGATGTFQPSLVTSTVSWPLSRESAIRQCLAPEWRITFVVASRITQPRTASDSRSR